MAEPLEPLASGLAGSAQVSRDSGGVAPGFRPSERQLARRAVASRRDRRSRLVAGASSIAALLVMVVVVGTSEGWPRVRETFLSSSDLRASFPKVWSGFFLNVRMFLVAEVLVLAFGLLLALARRSRAPVLFPARVLSVIYTDLFRGVPLILVVFIVGFGVPALRLSYLPKDPVVLGVAALTLSYSAYVAEVYRAGIESIHPAQWAAARSLGFTEPQALRFVVLPQAVRRVAAPLLNDFVSLQKDTALVAVLGPLEAVRQAQIYASSQFNYTSYLGAAVLFVLLTVPLARFTDRVAQRTGERSR